MTDDRELDVVTGAFSYTGARIAAGLLARGRRVRTLTFHPERPHPLSGEIEALPYAFADADALARSLEGAHTLYNTYWVRFERGATTFAGAVEHSRSLFGAARLAGVARIVHVSITNASSDSPLPYFASKGRVEQALAEVGVEHSIIRPTWIFGGEYEILVNNIAWILRHSPCLPVPGDGAYEVQPIHVDDMARICLAAGAASGCETIDAAGPQTLRFSDLVRLVRSAVGARGPVLCVPAPVMVVAARSLGALLGDVVLTADEIRGLSAGLLVSHEPPRGSIRFGDWLTTHAPEIGARYANEVRRHYVHPARG